MGAATVLVSRMGRCAGMVLTSPFAKAAVTAVDELIRGKMGAYVQETCGDVHLDLSLRDGRCCVRLKCRSDLPEFFETWVPLGEQDKGSRIELFVRRPAGQNTEHVPQKLA